MNSITVVTIFNSLKYSGPSYGHYLEPSKSVLIVHPDHIEAGKQFVLRHGFKICTVIHYIGGFIVYVNSKWDCLQDLMETWEK